MSKFKLYSLTAAIFSLITLTSCNSAIVTAGLTKAGVAITEERTIGTAVDDNIIWTKIKESYLQKNVDSLLAKVDVDVHNGRVLLTGVVNEPETKIEAAVLAWQPEGVTEVINEVQVANTQKLKDFAKDAAIATQVRGKLFIEKDLKSVNYTVDCVNGVVYLIGIAQDDKELKKATFLASKIKGVKKVVSHVQVKKPKA